MKFPMQYQLDRMEKLIPLLEQNHFIIKVMDSLIDAKEWILSEIPLNSSISVGGSVTLEQMAIIPEFRSSKYRFYDRYNQKDWNETVQCMRRSLLSDYFITSTNAITEDGELIQVDSGGNRASAMIYGPKNLIVVIGINKIVKDLDEAYYRLTEIGILNSKRLNHKTPCNITGVYEECTTKFRIFNFSTILTHGKREGGQSTIIFIKEFVGY